MQLIFISFFTSFLVYGLFFAGMGYLEISIQPLALVFYIVLLGVLLTAIITLLNPVRKAVGLSSAVCLGLSTYFIFVEKGADQIFELLLDNGFNLTDEFLGRIGEISGSIIDSVTFGILPLFISCYLTGVLLLNRHAESIID